MKSLGIVLIVAGIVMMAITGFNVVTRKKVVDIGPVQIDKKEDHPVQWSPIVGGVLLLGGVVVLLTSKKNA